MDETEGIVARRRGENEALLGREPTLDQGTRSGHVSKFVRGVLYSTNEARPHAERGHTVARRRRTKPRTRTEVQCDRPLSNRRVFEKRLGVGRSVQHRVTGVGEGGRRPYADNYGHAQSLHPWLVCDHIGLQMDRVDGRFSPIRNRHTTPPAHGVAGTYDC